MRPIERSLSAGMAGDKLQDLRLALLVVSIVERHVGMTITLSPLLNVCGPSGIFERR